ncbi:MAG: hypothetical protein K6F80_04155 [Oscillospiraceae bacterium]|nr:hypothetical protein [Oscillospiraceae bacterium]
MEIRFGRRKLCIDFGFPAMLSLILLSGERAFLLQTFLVCILHECGHGIAMCLTGAGLREIRLGGAGMQLFAETAVLTELQQLLISLAGPAVNLICALLFQRFHAESAVLHLYMGIFNLLPYRSLDGGTALRIFCTPPIFVSYVFSAVLCGLLIYFRLRNPLLYLMLLYLTVNESLR